MRSEDALRSSLIICSRNRLTHLKSRVEELAQLEKFLLDEILLVVNFKNNCDMVELIRYLNSQVSNEKFKVIRTEKGLPSARNLGIRNLSATDIVHFIDDDVKVNGNYFKIVNDFLKRNGSVIGGGPSHNTNIQFNAHKSRHLFLKRIAGIESEVGRLNKAMANSWSFQNLDIPVFCNWVSGAAMFYRYKDVVANQFNENLELGPLGGYALGEDLDFSFRIAKVGTLAIVPNLTVEHFYEENASNNIVNLYKGRGALSAYFKYSFRKEFSSLWILIRILVLEFYNMLHSHHSPVEFTRRLFYFMTGFLQELFTKRYQIDRKNST